MSLHNLCIINKTTIRLHSYEFYTWVSLFHWLFKVLWLYNCMRFGNSVITPCVKLPYKKNKHVGFLWFDMMAFSIRLQSILSFLRLIYELHSIYLHILFYYILLHFAFCRCFIVTDYGTISHGLQGCLL